MIKPKKELLTLFRSILEDVYNEEIKEQTNLKKQLENELKELNESKLRLTKKYIDDKLSERDYKLVNDDIEQAILDKKTILAGMEIPESSINQFLDSCCFALNNIKSLWESGGLEFRQRLQKLIYPEGASFDLSNFRTHKKSVIFEFLDRLTDNKFNMGRMMVRFPNLLRM